MSVNETLKERGSRYGDFDSHSAITQELKNVMRNGYLTNWKGLTFSQKEALEMIAHKIGRILNGDPNYAENWRDISGYSQLVVNELHKTNGSTDSRVVIQTVVNEKLTDVS